MNEHCRLDTRVTLNRPPHCHLLGEWCYKSGWIGKGQHTKALVAPNAICATEPLAYVKE